MKKTLLAFALFATTAMLSAQTLASFEKGIASKLTITQPEGYKSSLFKLEPSVVDNPYKTGANTSDKCLGAINVADADWWGNFIELELTKPVTISSSNRYLSFMAYRSIQPKDMRIGINGREDANQVFGGSLSADGKWETVEIDLLGQYEGKEVNSIWIIFSCNWSDPRKGWGEAEYYFDNFKLSSTPQPVAVSIDATKTYQTIDGFAASDCWAGNYVGQWEDKTREEVAKLLFSQKDDVNGDPEGIGLSMWRVNLGAGTAEQGDASGITDLSRRAECFLTSDGKYDWTKAAGQQYFMNKAKEYGVESFVAFSNSAPVSMTVNGKGYANAGGKCNLKSDMFGNFADYLTTVVDHFAEEGINFDYISPVNEPQYDWTDGQEGSPWSNDDIAKIAKELDTQITSKNLNTKILLSEAGNWNYLLSGSARANNQIYALFDSKSGSYVGNLKNMAPVIGGHSYWTFSSNSVLKSTRENVYQKASQYGLKVFQTEWSMLDKEPSTETGFPSSYDKATYMDIALFTAKVIHCDMEYANCSSWAYWTAMDQERYSHKNRFLLIKVKPSDGDYGTITNSGTAVHTPTLWVLGNYSRFVRPGYKRIALTGATQMNQLLGTAYISPDGSLVVAVYVNTSASEVNANIALSGMSTPESADVYVTKEGSNLKHVSSSAFSKTMTFAPRSVTTVVYKCTPQSVINKEVKSQMALYPSIVNAGANVTIEMPVGVDVETAKILTIDGRVAATVRLNGGNEKYSVTVPQLQSGVYVVLVETSNKTYASRVTVK